MCLIQKLLLYTLRIIYIIAGCGRNKVSIAFGGVPLHNQISKAELVNGFFQLY